MKQNRNLREFHRIIISIIIIYSFDLIRFGTNVIYAGKDFVKFIDGSIFTPYFIYEQPKNIRAFHFCIYLMVTVGTFIAFYWLKIFSNGERTEHMLRPLMRSNRKYRIFFTKKKSTRTYRVEDVESMRSFCRQANLVYIINSWFRLEYKKLSLRYQPTRLRNNKKRLNINFMTTFIQKLTQINHEVVDLSNEMSMMSFVVYGFYLFALDVELFLLIDRRSQLFFRLVLLNVFAVTIFFAVMIFTTLANLNQYSRQMIPIVRYYLHNYGEKVTFKPNLLDEYRLIELDHQFNDDLIGHDCARIVLAMIKSR
uniref:Uncharacterized protein LOC113793522 n=1 Tax=Dermatophagoides pteronyssinus TaxID=6956 RepID=A0A6P6Y1J3_DERPT|nr:uncharacterized protein LOC113793522 [Dermatophagoides pteronyssinus]